MPSFRNTLRIVLATCVGLAVLAGAAAVIVIWSGVYDIAATSQHPWPVFRTVVFALDRAIEHHAKGIQVPDLGKPEMVREGMPIYRQHCATCHGEPGLAPGTMAMGMTPVPPPIVSPARDRPPNQIFWLVKHGLKMTGMPGWEFKLTDAQIWSLVAFVKRLPEIAPTAYKDALAQPDPAKAFLGYLERPATQLARARTEPGAATGPSSSEEGGDTASAASSQNTWREVRPPLTKDHPRIATCETSIGGCPRNQLPAGFGDAERGSVALDQFACTSCHQIEGVVGRKERTGPPLRDMARLGYIAGRLPNTPDNLLGWIRHPQKISPGSAMPDMGVDEQTARDMVAYLYQRTR